jgi:iron complex transport system permease protein
MKKLTRPLLITLALLLAAMLLSIGVGSVFILPRDVISILWQALTGRISLSGQADVQTVILLTLRLPHMLLMIMTGAALAGSGCAYQGLFRNPLADPYLIGAASGAGLGAVTAMAFHWLDKGLGYLAVPLASFAGALLAVFLVFQLAKIGKTLPVTNLILAGVAVSSFATALSSFVMINSSGELRRALVWLLGGSTMAGWKPVIGMLPYAVFGLIGMLVMSYPLNVLQFGDEQAQQLGIRVSSARTRVILAATLATAAAVAFSGIIGFVGLIIPHIVRRYCGGDMRRLLPLSMLAGAAFMLIADILARVLMAPQELPVGIITALCGAPFFLFILRQSRQQMW